MLEIIGMTVEDAKIIEDCGADRIELVSALTEGGLTPSFGLIESVVNSVKIPVNVMIRPHAKSFVYSKEDISIMLKDINIVKEIGANGVVFGMLDKNDNIDEENLDFLLQYCDNLDVTFHRAIDESNTIESVNILKNYDRITNILTSGGKGNIKDNIKIIKDMMLNSNNIKILLGGGLDFNNIVEIKGVTKANNFHFGTAVRIDKSPFEDIDRQKLKQLVDIISK
ncbi:MULTISPECIES: copper homeostasis protein CutC [unclassified Clostridioides]|uniref:copper homeostasis protein CutC n=1 Tax=unclassified Clostridioides TaxID=2635829 RepID=UPI001D10610D|nr:copper homeostasis protein CutC [Clostridioides sp. ZZV14-6153]MCC0722439.1 copper homeostasis protein CutC [Clostridioides sp. ZZV14-6104]MCC0726532.1 copper homeostasis protein CutC [Clostridioides sp. ZZV14-6045]MCC0729984.1 copper homeostasis protein CutC [Clostridioides sp. ZZV14-6048]MCC0734866.1 copper homeostasis protein CutC [Clostridioides sp. ZZV14-6009]MCC0738126.1 copper homeostasis protein CutC [Clostridioides sp. ZZV14-5902]MCC0751384.1 copper homeostasis protein CutC [Clost